MVLAVPIIPTFLFLVERIASSTPGTITPKIGSSNVCLNSSKLLELAVLQAIITAFTFFVNKNRTICLENFVTVFFDFVP